MGKWGEFLDAFSFDPFWVLLHQVTGPVNLGFICRAMRNTGFNNLRITGPLSGEEPEANKFAVHADDLLTAMETRSSLEDLVSGMDSVYGFSPRSPWDDGRNLDLPGFLTEVTADLAAGRRIGLLFGNEANGLTNDDLAFCRYRVALPTDPVYTSMNLAQAVLVILWEIRSGLIHEREPLASLTSADTPAAETVQAPNLGNREVGTQPDLGGTARIGSGPDTASPEERAALITKVRHFAETFALLNPQNPEHIWREIRIIFESRDWSSRELQLLLALFNKSSARYQSLQNKTKKT